MITPMLITLKTSSRREFGGECGAVGVAGTNPHPRRGSALGGKGGGGGAVLNGSSSPCEGCAGRDYA